MKTNADITIYSKSINPTTRTEQWASSQVRDVFWEEAKAANVIKSGLLEADRVTVYIPMLRGQLSIRPGDVLVRGLVTDVIGSAFTITDLVAKYPASATVKSVDKLDRGSLHLQHYQIGAS